MATSISKKLQLRILDTLRTADTPLTTSEIAMLVNRSFETTRHALSVVGAKRVDDSYPTEWTIDDGFVPSSVRKAPSKFSEIEYTVSTKPVDMLVTAWNSSRANLAKSITDMEITPDSDPKDVALKLGTVAGSIAALSCLLDDVATRPDWYDTLTQER